MRAISRQVREPTNKTESRALDVYMRLSKKEKSQNITLGESSKLHTNRLRLIRFGVLVEVSEKELEQRARAAFRALPFYQRWWLKVVFVAVTMRGKWRALRAGR